jgi:hypothetical protein
VTFENAIEGQASEETLGRVVYYWEVLGPEVLTAAQPVTRTGKAVVVKRLREQFPSSDMENERHTRLCEPGPHRVEISVCRREVTGGLGG